MKASDMFQELAELVEDWSHAGAETIPVVNAMAGTVALLLTNLPDPDAAIDTVARKLRVFTRQAAAVSPDERAPLIFLALDDDGEGQPS